MVKRLRFHTITLGENASPRFYDQRHSLSDTYLREQDFHSMLEGDFGEDRKNAMALIQYFAEEVNTKSDVHVVIDEGMLPKTAEAIRKRIAGDEMGRFHAICGKARINLEL